MSCKLHWYIYESPVVTIKSTEKGTGERNGVQLNAVSGFGRTDYLFHIDILEIQDVFRYQEVTTVSMASEDISGLINLRGQILTAINLRLRLGMEPRPADRIPMNVVVRTQDEVVSLLVDQIGDVMEVSEDFYEQAPENIQGAVRELITGVYKLEDRLLLILDTNKVVQFNVAVP